MSWQAYIRKRKFYGDDLILAQSFCLDNMDDIHRFAIKVDEMVDFSRRIVLYDDNILEVRVQMFNIRNLSSILIKFY